MLVAKSGKMCDGKSAAAARIVLAHFAIALMEFPFMNNLSLVDGNPLENLGLVADPDKNYVAIMDETTGTPKITGNMTTGFQQWTDKAILD